MAWQSRGIITVVSNTLNYRATLNNTDPTANDLCHAVLIQAHPSNTGLIYVFDRGTGSYATGVGLLAVIAAPAVGAQPPSASAGIPFAMGGVNLADIYICAAVNTDKAIVSVLKD